MDRALLWSVVFVALLSLLLYPLVRAKAVAVSVHWPLLFILCLVGIFEWVLAGSWTRSVYLYWLVAFVMAGLLMTYQSFGPRRWYIFRAGGFYSDMDTYAVLAQAIGQALQGERLAPAAVMLRYDGYLGFATTTAEQEKRILGHIEDALEDTRFTSATRWRLFFGALWLVGVLTLVIDYLGKTGGLL